MLTESKPWQQEFDVCAFLLRYQTGPPGGRLLKAPRKPWVVLYALSVHVGPRNFLIWSGKEMSRVWVFLAESPTFSHEGCKVTAISAYIPRESITAGKLTMWSRLQRFLGDRFRKGRVPTPSDYLFDVLDKWYMAGQATGHAMVLLGDFNDTVDTRSQFGLCGWLNNLSLSAPLTDHFLPQKDYYTIHRAVEWICQSTSPSQTTRSSGLVFNFLAPSLLRRK